VAAASWELVGIEWTHLSGPSTGMAEMTGMTTWFLLSGVFT